MRTLRFPRLSGLALVLAFAATSAPSAFAVENSAADIPAAGSAGRLQLGLAGVMNGSVGENVYSEERRDYSPVSDYGTSLEGRYFFTENFALGLSLALSSEVADRDARTQRLMDAANAGKEGVFGNPYELKPTLFGVRYQARSLVGYSSVRPFAQAEVGPTWISHFDMDGEGPALRSARPSARFSTGLDVYFGPGSRAFAGLQFSYLTMKDLAFAQTQLNLGFLLF